MANSELVLGQAQTEINNAGILLPSDILIRPTLPSGYSAFNDRVYYYKIGTRVFLSIGLIKDDGTRISTYTTLFNLPVGYRPLTNLALLAMPYGSTVEKADLYITPDGDVNGMSDDKGIFGVLTFDAFQ